MLMKTFKMEKVEFRAVIKFLTMQGKSPQTILEEMSAVYGDFCPGKTMIYKWHNLFKQGRDSIEDDSRSGRPIEATTPEIVQKVKKLVLKDARLKKRQLAEMIGVSATTILNILHDHLGITKNQPIPITAGEVASTSNLECLCEPNEISEESAPKKPKESDLITKCNVCNELGSNDNLVRCDECMKCYHFTCLEPKVKTSPKRRGYSWYCADCNLTDVESN